MIEWWWVVILFFIYALCLSACIRAMMLLDEWENTKSCDCVPDINKPDKKEYHEEHGYKPCPPMKGDDNSHTNSKADNATPNQVLDAIPCLIAHIALNLKRIIGRVKSHVNPNREEPGVF